MIHITDGKTDRILSIIDETEFWEDKHTKSLKDTLETFDFTTFADKRFSEHLAERNRVIIPDEDGEYIEFIIENTRKFHGADGLFIEVYTSASYIELAKAKVIDPQTTPSWTAKQHAEMALSGTEWAVGTVDFAGSRTITIESYTNPYSYLKQIASEFNLELHFRVETDSNKVTRRYVDLIEHVGGWNGREVEFGKDLMGIERKEDFSNIVTALVGIGPERDDGTRLQVFVEDKDALARWGRNGKHLVDVYEPDSIDSNMTLERLRSLTEAELSKRINSVVEYTADVADLEKVPGLEHEKFRFGDTIRIKDTAFAPPLYLEARIHTVERSIKRDGQKTVTLGDYIEYTEEDVFAIYKRLQAEIAKKVSFSSLDSELQTKVNNGDSAKATVDNWKVPGKTTIDGSKIETESITWDKAKGGTLTLGGSDNQNGRLVVLDANGEEIADLDATKGGFTNLYVANLDSPSTIKYSDQDYTFYVSDRKLTSYAGAVDPDDSNDGTSWAKPLATIGEALRRIPKYFDGTANIYINSGGILYQDIDLRGFIGKGAIYINGQSTSTRMNGNIIINSNLCHIYISNLTVNGRAGSYAVISSAKNSFVDFTNVIVYGNNSTRGFDIVQSGYTQVQSCQIYDCDHAISGRYSATVWVKDCSGYGNVYGLYAYGGYIVGYGTAPNGATFKAESVGGKIFATHTANNGAYTPPPPPTTTSVWTSTGGDSWRDNFGGQWYGTGEVVQGYWGGYGIYKGLWFFGSAPSSAVTGKTIKSMRLYVTRNASGGNSGAVTVYFRPHTYTSRPSGNPSFLSPYTTATFKWGEGKWITLPSSFYSVFQSGQAKGIGIYIDSTSSSYYAKFSGTAKLEITYA